MSRQNHNARWGRGRILGILGCLYALVACSTAENYGVLSFFFDGVPNPNAIVSSPEVGGSFVGPPIPAAMANSRHADALQPSIHEPYKVGKCDECHRGNRGAMMQGLPGMRKPINQLCFSCHELAPRRWTHAPAVSGACVLCHAPHDSPNPALLLQSDLKEICGQCHEGETFPTAVRHAGFGERTCSDCHDPHSADALNLLRPGWEGGAMAEQEASVLLKDGDR